MARIVTEGMIAMRLMPIRVLFYYLSPCVLSFISLTETWSDQTWAEMGAFTRTRFYISVLGAGISPFLAFIDQSYQRAREDYQRRNEAKHIQATAAANPAPTPDQSGFTAFINKELNDPKK